MSSEQKSYEDDSIHPLAQMGWTSHFQSQLEPLAGDEAVPARVIGVRKNRFCTSDGQNEWLATLAGRLKHYADGLYPVTGDWVLMSDTVISRVLARRNALSRGAAGTHTKQEALARSQQVIAAHLDTVFIVCGLDRDFNLRRIERYLTLVYNCGLTPVIILTKADLHQDPARFAREVKAVAIGVSIHLVSAAEDTGLSALEPYLSYGQTTTMVGSSGAGKSTLINRLCGKTVQRTAAVSAHVGKGSHTTTSRDMIRMPQGGDGDRQPRHPGNCLLGSGRRDRSGLCRD